MTAAPALLLLLPLLCVTHHLAAVSAEEQPEPPLRCHPAATPPEICPDGEPCPQCGEEFCECPGPPSPPPPGCPFFAQAILMDLYNNTAGQDWRSNDGWASDDTPCCEWHGVTCNHNSSTIVKLRLAENGLSGTLVESLGLLDGLDELVIYGNAALSGTIPERLARLSELKKLYLHYNSLSGTVPPLIGMDRLSLLHIGGQKSGGLQGGLQWLGDLRALEEVLIWDNSFTGTLPERMRTMSRLKRLELGNNPLNSDFPSWLGELGNLTELSAYETGLTGHVPASLGGVGQPHLQRLFLRDNQISGTLNPAMIENLTALADFTELSLTDNQISGSLPTALSSIPGLRSLYLSHTKFTTMDPEMVRPPFLDDPRNRWDCQLQKIPWICPIPEWAKDDCKAVCGGDGNSARRGVNVNEVVE
jgi:hypothetical protein